MNYNNDIPSARIMPRGGGLVPEPPKQPVTEKKRGPYIQDPARCKHVYREADRKGDVILFCCKYCLDFQSRRVPDQFREKAEPDKRAGFWK